MAVADAVFVQPHFDDIALSCGGTVAQMARTGSPLIVTVCGGAPRGELSPFARQQHDWWRLDDAAVVEERCREDECAARALGESVRTLALDISDAIYRRAEYASENALFGQLVQADHELVFEVSEALAELGEPLIMPLAVGGHVDHRLVHLAGMNLHVLGHEVWFYADLPYALKPGELDVRLRTLAHGVIFSRSAMIQRMLTRDDFERRWQAIECYQSQLPVLFRAMDDPRGEFEAFTRDVRTGQLRERFWRFEIDEETRV